MDLNSLLINLGVGITSDAIYDFIRNKFINNKYVDFGAFKSELEPLLRINNADIAADKIIKFLAENGDIEIQGSQIFAKNSIVYSSDNMTKFSIKNSTSTTDKTKIDIGDNAEIIGQGGAAIKQNEDGSISFYT